MNPKIALWFWRTVGYLLFCIALAAICVIENGASWGVAYMYALATPPIGLIALFVIFGIPFMVFGYINDKTQQAKEQIEREQI